MHCRLCPLPHCRRWYTEVNSTPALRMGESSLQKKLVCLSDSSKLAIGGDEARNLTPFSTSSDSYLCRLTSPMMTWRKLTSHLMWTTPLNHSSGEGLISTL